MHMSARLAVAALTCVIGLGTPAAAEEEEEALVAFHTLAPRLAMDLAVATLEACAERGFNVAAAVVDRSGVPQAMIRGRLAGAHTPEAATRKAWTAASFRTNTLELERYLGGPGQIGYGASGMPGALLVGGGVIVEAAGEIVGAIGVAVTPNPEFDEDCARDGLVAIADRLPPQIAPD